MADAPSSGGKTFEDIVLIFFALFLAGQAFERAPEIFRETLGLEKQSEYLVEDAVLSDTTPLGTRVNAPEGTAYFKEVGGGERQAGTFLPGTSLILTKGPKSVEEESWWFVEDPRTQERGWVRQKLLIVEGVSGIGPHTKIGSKAKALMTTSVWSKPGGGEKVGEVGMGEAGELTKGPSDSRGIRWWFFDKEVSGQDGWVPEPVLLLASNKSWEKGSALEASYGSSIFERAGGGNTLGFLSENEKVKVLGGPIEIGGMFWWLIQSDKDIEGWVSENALQETATKGWFNGFLAVFMIVGTLAMIGFLVGIIYVTIRTNQIRAREVKRIEEAIAKKSEPKKSERWETIEKNALSEHPSEWRLAILEADIILDELLTKIGYTGDTIGEKLKQVARGDLRSLDFAWEAHKVRNQIAHEGGDFILTQREAQRVIEMYRTVFRELRYI